MTRQLAGFVARFAGTADVWPNTVDRARRRNPDLAHQGGAAITVALHAAETMVSKRARDAIEIAIVIGREPGPVAGKRAASTAAPTERSGIRCCRNPLGPLHQGHVLIGNATRALGQCA